MFLIKKLIPGLFMLFTIQLIYAQEVPGIHQKLKGLSPEVEQDLSSLVTYLTKDMGTESEKAAILHRWLIGYLHYDESFKIGNPSKRNQMINVVLKNKKAVCQGYANLFAAISREAGLTTEVIYGYARQNSDNELQLTEPDHAWNAIQLDGTWYLLDPTWDSGLLHGQGLDQGLYYLADPKKFVQSHLPADPMWQLLPQPVPMEIFAKNKEAVESYLNSQEDQLTYYSFQDSLKLFLAKSPMQRRLHTAIRAYQNHPTPSNAKELTANYIDYESWLSDHPPTSEEADSLINYHRQMVELCTMANQFSKLFANQAENCAYNYINYGVALSRKLETAETRAAEMEIIQEMKSNFLIAQKRLEQLPQNLFIEQALDRCNAYLEFCNTY